MSNNWLDDIETKKKTWIFCGINMRRRWNFTERFRTSIRNAEKNIHQEEMRKFDFVCLNRSYEINFITCRNQHNDSFRTSFDLFIYCFQTISRVRAKSIKSNLIRSNWKTSIQEINIRLCNYTNNSTFCTHNQTRPLDKYVPYLKKKVQFLIFKCLWQNYPVVFFFLAFSAIAVIKRNWRPFEYYAFQLNTVDEFITLRFEKSQILFISRAEKP